MENIEDRIEGAAQSMTPRPAIAMELVQEPLQTLPLSISEVAWIGGAHADHCTLSHFHIGYKTGSLCIDLVMDHLRHRFDMKLLHSHDSFSFEGVPELREELALHLRQVFGWEKEAIEAAIAQYEINKLFNLSFA